MGSLTGMITFLKKTSENLESIIEKLDKIQNFFNSNFSNVNMIRNAEYEFLQDEFFANKKNFPSEIIKMYEKQLKKQEPEFDKNFSKLSNEKSEVDKEMNKANSERSALLTKKSKKNKRLDRREERIKQEIIKLNKAIAEYNRKIDELNSGFGIIINIFQMRKIQKTKDDLLEKRDDLVDEIEEIRGKWLESVEKFSEQEKNILNKWNDIKIKQSLISEKIETLKQNRDDIIKKAAFAAALNELKGDEPFLIVENENRIPGKCPRCKSANRDNKYFCFYCGERFSKDRKDITGSLAEVGELNEVHSSLLSGIKQSVSFLALIQGISEGVGKFTKSIQSVKETQDRYSALSRLNINVPSFSMKFSENIKILNSKIDVKFYNLHPLEFSNSFKKYEEKVFTGSHIENFFKKMGNELNKTTREQWK